MQWCILCGKELDEHDDRRYKQLDALANLLRERCHSTPFVYRYLQEEHKRQSGGGGEGTTTVVKCPCCIACINWIRRLNIPYYMRRRRAKKVPIQMDNLLLFLHCPGAAIAKPDQRSFVRLVKNLVVQKANPYSKFLTPLMERALRRIEASSGGSMVDQLVMAWWENNGKQVILPDRITASYIRRALRRLPGLY